MNRNFIRHCTGKVIPIWAAILLVLSGCTTTKPQNASVSRSQIADAKNIAVSGNTVNLEVVKARGAPLTGTENSLVLAGQVDPLARLILLPWAVWKGSQKRNIDKNEAQKLGQTLSNDLIVQYLVEQFSTHVQATKAFDSITPLNSRPPSESGRNEPPKPQAIVNLKSQTSPLIDLPQTLSNST